MSRLKYPYKSDAVGSSEYGGEAGNGSTTTGRAGLIKTTNVARQQYVNVVRLIPEVIKVLLVEGDEGPSLLTVISAAPFDDGPRSSAFDVQVDFMQRMEAPLVGFHLLNIQELPGQDLEHQGLESHQVLWSR